MAQKSHYCKLESHASRAGASGEVGLLGEEAAQRLLSIFAEAAGSCLAQIHTMSLAHGDAKYNTLYNVGLDILQRWDQEVAQEEIVRMENAYPEVPSLHSFVFLWLLDRVCEDQDIKTLAVPPLSEIYASFMKRVGNHADTRRGREFIDGFELCRRTVYVDSFRGAYHDFLHRRENPRQGPRALPRARREPVVSPDEAASQIGGSQAFCPKPSQAATSSNGASVRHPSALHLAIEQHSSPSEKRNQESSKASKASSALSIGVQAEPQTAEPQTAVTVGGAPGSQSGGIRAVAVGNPCFFFPESAGP